MANYIATTEELTAVADAIRAKGGTSEQLVFPEGFVSAIGALETGGGESSGIPSQYTRVEYLESHGTEYIDTGITLAKVAIADFSVMVTDKSAFNGLGIAGVNTPSVPYASFAHYFSGVGDKWYIPPDYFNRYGTNIWSPNIAVKENNRQNFLLEMPFGKYGCFTIDGVGQKTTYTGRSSLDDTTPITIFALNGGDEKLCAPFRLYYFRMLDQGYNVVRDFIPCKVKATGEAGLYDLVSKQFFGNLGTSAFTAGDEVT